MKTVVSVSLGSSKRDKVHETDIMGVPFRIERRGTDGDLEKFASLFRELDGQVDALGVGGADIWLVAGHRRWAFKEIQRLVAGAKVTPVVDGSGLKHTLEREAVKWLNEAGVIDFAREKVLLVSAVDRFGMAQALHEVCPQMIFGDLMFGLGLPVPVRRYSAVQALAALLLPVVTRLPFKWFYPTGEKQERRTPKHTWAFDWATVVCGDWHYIRRFAPERMTGKTILTQTVRQNDIDWLRSTGAGRLVTTTPVMGGETFATNVIEGVIVALLGRRPEDLSPADYIDCLSKIGWRPTVIPLDPLREASLA
ncbi:MAG: hypothetical protein KF884_06635 [Fimbriimonadaceae bacterium]|nr:hypothetical protein [Fimbriimonadaceae bacterium]QYK57226.1 MAG: hypothetical protein KF884_06635 [Fimbriimonadaceae bacterium]